jgi:hypothetical protein
MAILLTVATVDHLRRAGPAPGHYLTWSALELSNTTYIEMQIDVPGPIKMFLCPQDL